MLLPLIFLYSDGVPTYISCKFTVYSSFDVSPFFFCMVHFEVACLEKRKIFFPTSFFTHDFPFSGEGDKARGGEEGREVHPEPPQGGLLRGEGAAGVRGHNQRHTHRFPTIKTHLITIIPSEEKRTANIVADDPEGVACLVIDRESFHHLISNLADIKTRYVDLPERKKM